MSGNAQQDYIIETLEVIREGFFDTVTDPDERERLQKALNARALNLRSAYDKEQAIVEGLSEEDKRRKEFEKNTENLAKALPNITKGTLTAITAFQKDDPISGSAAIMDICASLAPLLGGLSAAGGPPGMLVGAIFAMVGQILSFFAPKSESLTSQIETLMRKLQAEKVAQKIKAVHKNITNYASALRNATGRISTALDQPGLQIRIIKNIIKDVNPIEGNIITDYWEVTEWLMDEANQNQDQWPTILAAVCQAYTDLLVTVITLLSLVSTDKMRAQFDEAEKLPADEKKEVKGQLTGLRALAITRLIEYGACNETHRRTLKRLMSAAQNRGMLWYIGFEKGPLYAGTNIRQGRFENLASESKRLAVAVSRKDMGSPNPLYHVFLLEPGADPYGRIYYKDVSAPYKNQGYFQELKCDGSSIHDLSDIWTATPVAIKNEVCFYGAKGTEIHGYVLDENKKVRSTYNKKAIKSKVVSVRVVHNPESFVDDPDENAQLPSVLKGINYFVYGGLQNSSEIYTDAGGEEGYVRSPWPSYSGLGVDQHYLWVFRSSGFACATHASVMRCLKGKIQQPRWMTHDPNEVLYHGSYYHFEHKVRNRPDLLGLVDLCPCDDETLAAALYTRSVVDRIPKGNTPGAIYTPIYEFVDTNAVYSAAYHTDLKNATIAVDWTKIGGENLLVRVQKLPVFCWSQIESLTATLDVLAPVLKSV
jgi:hypothetical protein